MRFAPIRRGLARQLDFGVPECQLPPGYPRLPKKPAPAATFWQSRGKMDGSADGITSPECRPGTAPTLLMKAFNHCPARHRGGMLYVAVYSVRTGRDFPVFVVFVVD
jgi:hypothetical protein